MLIFFADGEWEYEVLLADTLRVSASSSFSLGIHRNYVLARFVHRASPQPQHSRLRSKNIMLDLQPTAYYDELLLVAVLNTCIIYFQFHIFHLLILD